MSTDLLLTTAHVFFETHQGEYRSMGATVCFSESDREFSLLVGGVDDCSMVIKLCIFYILEFMFITFIF